MPPKLRSLLFALLAMAGASACAQQLTFDQLARASKIYFRDTAEFPMRMSLDFSAIDSRGKMRKHKTGNFDYDFHGYNPLSQKAHLSMHGPRSGLKAGASAGVAVVLPISVLYTNAEDYYRFVSAEGSAPGLLSAKLTPVETCLKAQWSVDTYLLNQTCGSWELEVTKDELELRRYHFETAGLPAQGKIDYLGSATVNRLYVDADFQEVQIPSDPKPFLVPKKVLVTVETDKGKLLITGDFTPKPQKK
jgi:hypothetical protein